MTMIMANAVQWNQKKSILHYEREKRVKKGVVDLVIVRYSVDARCVAHARDEVITKY